MCQENVELVQTALQHFATTGEPDWDGLHEDVKVYDHDIMDAGDYWGHRGFARWLQDWASAWSEYTMEPEEFLDAGDRVVVFILQKTTGHGSGVGLERHDAMVFELRDAKILRVDYHNNRQQALKAVGLPE
ncbi:MAG TPA: nuclear transport factor 2 family protein [Solirubrobacteraceae bacterium]|nr:nuclear transport factor 2 family protein [Solirubrobacteraceae bacterium]